VTGVLGASPAQAFAAAIIPVPRAAAAQTITFAQPADVALGATPYALVATASSKLPVAFASNTLTVCTITPTGTVTIKALGNCSITASQAGQAAKWKAATPVTRTFAVKSPQTLTFTLSKSSMVFGDAAPRITASSSAGLTVTLTSSTTPVCTLSAQTITVLKAGTCTIVASQAGSATVVAAPSVTQSFTVALKPQVISWAQELDVVGPDDGPITLEASASSGLTVSFTATPASVCTLSGVDVTLVSLGNCVITARQAGDTKYAAAPSVVKTLKIRSPQEITFDQISDQTLEDLLVELEASSDSGLSVSFSSSTTNVCIVRGGFIVLKSAGTCAITARQPGNTSYGPAEPVVVSFEVTKVEQIITFEQPEDQTLDAGILLIEASSDSDLPVRFTSATKSVCKVSSFG